MGFTPSGQCALRQGVRTHERYDSDEIILALIHITVSCRVDVDYDVFR